MTTQQIAAAIATFATDIENSRCMGTRRDAVMFLANKIGSTHANQIAEMFGLVGNFYRV